MKKKNGRYELYGNPITPSKPAQQTDGKPCCRENFIMTQMKNLI